MICEARIDWWDALITWLRSLGGSKGICDILQRLQDFTKEVFYEGYHFLVSLFQKFLEDFS